MIAARQQPSAGGISLDMLIDSRNMGFSTQQTYYIAQREVGVLWVEFIEYGPDQFIILRRVQLNVQLRPGQFRRCSYVHQREPFRMLIDIQRHMFAGSRIIGGRCVSLGQRLGGKSMSIQKPWISWNENIGNVISTRSYERFYTPLDN